MFFSLKYLFGDAVIVSPANVVLLNSCTFHLFRSSLQKASIVLPFVCREFGVKKVNEAVRSFSVAKIGEVGASLHL